MQTYRNIEFCLSVLALDREHEAKFQTTDLHYRTGTCFTQPQPLRADVQKFWFSNRLESIFKHREGEGSNFVSVQPAEIQIG